jgi:hypothetical protein
LRTTNPPRYGKYEFRDGADGGIPDGDMTGAQAEHRE